MSLFKKDAEEIEKYLGISLTTDVDKIYPKCSEVERTFLRKNILGIQLYGDLLAHYQADTLTTEEENLLPFVQAAVAHLAYSISLGIINVSISSNGIRQAHSEEYKPAFEWAVDDAKTDIVYSAFRAIEELLIFLEENIEDYPTWESSLGFFKKRKNFVQSAVDMTEWEEGIQENRRYYLAVQGIMNEVEDLVIKPSIGIPYFLDLKNKIKANPIGTNDEDKIVLELLKKAITKITFGRSITELDLNIYNINVTSERAATSIKAGELYLAEAKKYLNETASSLLLPVYFGSSTYKAPPSDDSDFEPFKNDKTKRIFVA